MRSQLILKVKEERKEKIKALRTATGLNNKQKIISKGDFENLASTSSSLDSRVAINFDERQINSWDLVDINYLFKGYAAAKSVCKLHARDEIGPYEGTAFLISNHLLVTNWHNLKTFEIAKKAFVEFDHEIAPNEIPKNSERFILKPYDAYWTDQDLDICIVAVESLSQGNIPIEKYGFLRLDPEVGKIKKADFISIIHHPSGTWKQVALRENRLIEKEENILLYASDTATGSSGAPCFSDKWQVVAIHRRGVPQTKEDDINLIQLRNGDYLTREQINQLRIPESDILWLANEGVRVSVFVSKVKNDPIANNPLIADWLSKLGPNKFNDLTFESSEITSKVTFIENRRPKNDYEKRNGFQEGFLEISIPKPTFTKAKKLWGNLSYNSDTGETELPYYNYSIWMNKPRCMALVTASNIDGKTFNERYRKEFGSDKWVYDDRLPERLQIGNWFYSNEPARYNKNYFDRGHITRRTEPCWGNDEMAKLANDDTFHWTNCSPQYKNFNQKSLYWQGLEQFLVDNGCVKHKLKMSIFSGPIFSDNDTEHRGVLIPRLFFKIGVYVDRQGKLKSSGYVLDQSKWVNVIDFEKERILDIPKSRRSISWIETKTGIDFGKLVREADEAFGLDDHLAIESLPDFFANLTLP